MVANIRTGATVGGAIRYNEEKVNCGQAEVLFWHRMLDPFHVSLNPSPEDRLTDEQLGEIAREYMERMGYGEQPYIVFKHGDIAREHLHVVSLRVDSMGRKISDSHEYDRSMSILRDLEQKYGLHPSIKGQELQDREGLRKVDYPKGDVKQQVSSFNVSAEERTGTIDGRDYAGMIYGALTDDSYGIGTPFKSSRIGKDVGYEALQRYYERSKAALKEPGALDGLRGKVVDEMERCTNRAEFCERLHDKGVDAVFRLNAAGRIYGVTFIDHKQGIVANGSLLGRSFSANAFEQQFHIETMSMGVSRSTSKQPQSSSKELYQSDQSIHPLDAILELADVQTYEEQQQVSKRKRKPRIRRL